MWIHSDSQLRLTTLRAIPRPASSTHLSTLRLKRSSTAAKPWFSSSNSRSSKRSSWSCNTRVGLKRAVADNKVHDIRAEAHTEATKVIGVNQKRTPNIYERASKTYLARKVESARQAKQINQQALSRSLGVKCREKRCSLSNSKASQSTRAKCSILCQPSHQLECPRGCPRRPKTCTSTRDTCTRSSNIYKMVRS